MNNRIVDLAIVELNRKFSAIVQYYMSGMSQSQAEEKATTIIQDDLDRIIELTGKIPFFDNNYSCTWGYKAYGIYDSLEEMDAVQKLVDAGF